MLIQSSTIVNNRPKSTLPIHLWVNQLVNSQINLKQQWVLMVLHIVVEEVETEEVLVVLKTEAAEEVSKHVVVKDNNLDNLTDQIQAEEKVITRVRLWECLSSRQHHRPNSCKQLNLILINLVFSRVRIVMTLQEMQFIHQLWVYLDKNQLQLLLVCFLMRLQLISSNFLLIINTSLLRLMKLMQSLCNLKQLKVNEHPLILL